MRRQHGGGGMTARVAGSSGMPVEGYDLPAVPISLSDCFVGVSRNLLARSRASGERRKEQIVRSLCPAAQAYRPDIFEVVA
jgi:hypothetical protein